MFSSQIWPQSTSQDFDLNLRYLRLLLLKWQLFWANCFLKKIFQKNPVRNMYLRCKFCPKSQHCDPSYAWGIWFEQTKPYLRMFYTSLSFLGHLVYGKIFKDLIFKDFFLFTFLCKHSTPIEVQPYPWGSRLSHLHLHYLRILSFKFYLSWLINVLEEDFKDWLYTFLCKTSTLIVALPYPRGLWFSQLYIYTTLWFFHISSTFFWLVSFWDEDFWIFFSQYIAM